MNEIRLEHIITAIKALYAAERAMETDTQVGRAITECQIARARLEASVGGAYLVTVELL